MKRISFIVLLMVMTMALSAQSIKADLKEDKKGNFTGTYAINGIQGQTYSIEVWVCEINSDKFFRIDGLDFSTGPGLAYNSKEKISIDMDQIPKNMRKKGFQLKFKLIPDPREIWSETLVFNYDQKDSDSKQEKSWIGENLLNIRDLTFGVMSFGTHGSNLTVNFTMTNSSRREMELSWNRDEAVMMRINTTRGGQQIVTTGNLYFEGQSRGNYGYYIIPPETTVEGFIRLPFSHSSAESIKAGTFTFFLPHLNQNQVAHFGEVEKKDLP